MLTEQDVAAGLTRFHSWWRRTAPRSELSTSSASVLDVLQVDGPHRLSDLAARERLSQPGMTALVNRLEADGLVSRAPDPSDGRVARVGLTAAGRDRLDAVRAVRSAELRRRVGQLSDADRRALERALPALERLVSSDRPDPLPPTTSTPRTSSGHDL